MDEAPQRNKTPVDSAFRDQREGAAVGQTTFRY